MQKRCILCADPDPELRSNLGFLLAGENCVLEETAGGATLLTQLRRNTDLVILPQQLPDMSGFDACTALRRQSAAPVLFLLEKADESAKTLSFSVGGDDCLEKPVSCHELAVRVKALLRRYCVYGARPAGLERRSWSIASSCCWPPTPTKSSRRRTSTRASGRSRTFTAVRTPSWSTSATSARR